jgi:hypothetical protein
MIVAFVPSEAERDCESFFDANGSPLQRGDRGLKAATLRASQCAHHLATKLGHMRMKMNGQVRCLGVANASSFELDHAADRGLQPIGQFQPFIFSHAGGAAVKKCSFGSASSSGRG